MINAFVNTCVGCPELHRCPDFGHFSYLDDVYEATTDISLREALDVLLEVVHCPIRHGGEDASNEIG